MPSHQHDLVIIGAGPGGYAAAFLAADLGLNVTLIDEETTPGGVCLYRGCIPSKALLHVAKVLSDAKAAKNFGVEFPSPKINLDQVRSWKKDVVAKLTGGLGQLCRQRKINFLQGRASFVSSNSLKVQRANGPTETLNFEHGIIATGSRPAALPNLPPNSPRILDSTSALEVADIPESLLVVGGGYIGLELGTVYAELGSRVSVVEMTSGLLPGTDRDLAEILTKRLKGLFAGIWLNAKVIKMEEAPKAMKVTIQEENRKETQKEFQKVLVSVGRRPNTEGLDLKNTKVERDGRGFIKVNGQRRTTDPALYAIGDVAGEPMLAHKASHEGRVAVEAIAGHKTAFEPNAIPAVVFTDPEIAWCGLTETEAARQNRSVKVVKFPWAASGRAITLDRTDGLTKLMIDPQTERILGVAIAGVGAGELIAEGVLAVEMGSLASDVKLSIHPHPTLSETVMESAESFFGQSTHIYKPRPQ